MDDSAIPPCLTTVILGGIYTYPIFRNTDIYWRSVVFSGPQFHFLPMSLTTFGGFQKWRATPFIAGWYTMEHPATNTGWWFEPL